MSPLFYSGIFGLFFGLLVGNYTAWALYEFGVASPTFIGMLAAVAVGFGSYVLLRRLA